RLSVDLDCADPGAGDERIPVFTAVKPFAGPSALALQLGKDGCTDPRVLVRGVSLVGGDMLADELAGLTVKHPLQRRIGIANLALLGGEADAFCHVVEQNSDECGQSR